MSYPVDKTTTSPLSARPKREAKPAPFSLRLSENERLWLERRAGDMTLGAYIRAQLFADNARPRRGRQRRPVKDEQALAQALGQLGNARLANNLNQLAKAVNIGTLPVTRETEDALRQACDAVQAMRQMLMRALGFMQ